MTSAVLIVLGEAGRKQGRDARIARDVRPDLARRLEVRVLAYSIPRSCRWWLRIYLSSRPFGARSSARLTDQARTSTAASDASCNG